MRDGLGLSRPQFEQVLKNTCLAAGILSDSSRAGRLRFDLDPDAFLLTGKVEKQQLDCGKPEAQPLALIPECPDRLVTTTLNCRVLQRQAETIPGQTSDTT